MISEPKWPFSSVLLLFALSIPPQTDSETRMRNALSAQSRQSDRAAVIVGKPSDRRALADLIWPKDYVKRR